MIARITPRRLRGTVAAIPSKSEAHRALICAALADAPTEIHMGEGSEDIEATIRCLTDFGASISKTDFGLYVEPIYKPTEVCDADCGESGSTLRFLLPVAGALGIDARFRMRGRLPERPIFPLDRELTRGGCEITRPERDVLRITGKLRPGNYELPGDVSSQYISGLLFALPTLVGNSTLTVTGKRESVNYIKMTLQSLARFGVSIKQTEVGYEIPAENRYRSPGSLRIGGDWSNAAFWLCADALPGCEVRVTGLDADSAQGDRRVAAELRRMTQWQAEADARREVPTGACARMETPSEAVLDASDIPDLVPILAATACARGQGLRIVNAARLRIKESDRLASVRRALCSLGGAVEETDDGLIVAPCSGRPIPTVLGSECDSVPVSPQVQHIGELKTDFGLNSAPTHTCDADAYCPQDYFEPSLQNTDQSLFYSEQSPLRGGEVDACGDHRIAMMAAIASCACESEVIVRGAEAVNKSYPGFWRDFAALGGCVELTED